MKSVKQETYMVHKKEIKTSTIGQTNLERMRVDILFISEYNVEESFGSSLM